MARLVGIRTKAIEGLTNSVAVFALVRASARAVLFATANVGERAHRFQSVVIGMVAANVRGTAFRIATGLVAAEPSQFVR